MKHIPVLQKEVLDYLNPKANQNFIDCTIGSGGHATAILEKNRPKGKVLGIEVDSELIKNLASIERLILVNDNFRNLKIIVEKYNFGPVQGILLDLGISSWHLEKSGRGFSFQRDESLDMRYRKNNFTAEEIINTWLEKEIEKILREYGEERFARRIAREIIKERKVRPIKTTFRLIEVVKKAISRRYLHQRIHFATRTFQALRIAVNNELENLEKVLSQAINVLEPKGRLVVISFHSLEDRIVKNFLRDKSKEGLVRILTKKPIRPTLEEIRNNPRARSAKLRAALKNS